MPKVIFIIFIQAVSELEVIPYSSFCCKFRACHKTINKYNELINIFGMKKIFKSIFWAELLLFHFEKSRFSFQKNGAYSYDVKTFFGFKFFFEKPFYLHV